MISFMIIFHDDEVTSWISNFFDKKNIKEFALELEIANKLMIFLDMLGVTRAHNK